jgi:hypothetical protein
LKGCERAVPPTTEVAGLLALIYETNHALAIFASGKQYNCDLSASYNIGARYFVRELLKPLPVMVRSQLSAKVPEAERRIQVTLATLKVLYHEYQKLTAQAA